MKEMTDIEVRDFLQHGTYTGKLATVSYYVLYLWIDFSRKLNETKDYFSALR